MKLRFKNSKKLAVLMTALFLLSLFPGYGFAEEPIDLSKKIVETSDSPGDQLEEGNPDGIPGGNPLENPGDDPEGTLGEDPQDNPGDNPGTPGEDLRDNPGEDPEATPGEGPQDNPGEDPEGTPGEGPQDNPGEDPEGTPGEDPQDDPGEKPEEQLLLMQQMPVIPEKVTLTINHVLDRGDGGGKLTYIETVENLDAGTTVLGSDYQVLEEGIAFVGSQPEQLVLDANEANTITLLYRLNMPAEEELEEVIVENNPDNLSEYSTGITPAKSFYYPSSPRMMMRGAMPFGINNAL